MQAIVISGESGAGKTEAAKLVLQYMTEMSGQASMVGPLFLCFSSLLPSRV